MKISKRLSMLFMAFCLLNQSLLEAAPKHNGNADKKDVSTGTDVVATTPGVDAGVVVAVTAFAEAAAIAANTAKAAAIAAIDAAANFANNKAVAEAAAASVSVAGASISVARDAVALATAITIAINDTKNADVAIALNSLSASAAYTAAVDAAFAVAAAFAALAPGDVAAVSATRFTEAAANAVTDTLAAFKAAFKALRATRFANTADAHVVAPGDVARDVDDASSVKSPTASLATNTAVNSTTVAVVHETNKNINAPVPDAVVIGTVLDDSAVKDEKNTPAIVKKSNPQSDKLNLTLSYFNIVRKNVFFNATGMVNKNLQPNCALSFGFFEKLGEKYYFGVGIQISSALQKAHGVIFVGNQHGKFSASAGNDGSYQLALSATVYSNNFSVGFAYLNK